METGEQTNKLIFHDMLQLELYLEINQKKNELNYK